jgi:ATP-binding cassette subfamily C protein
VRAWQRRIGYVPQAPYLIDDSLRANVAFGVPPPKIDDDRVRECLRLANLASLPAEVGGLEAMLGEQGSRISGGQRQRIAIARALYDGPDILVFDEATSSLDNISERQILTALDEVRHYLTLIVIAHRLTTIARSDRVFLLDKGRLVAEGSYDDLLRTSPLFRELAAVPRTQTSIPA